MTFLTLKELQFLREAHCQLQFPFELPSSISEQYVRDVFRQFVVVGLRNEIEVFLRFSNEKQIDVQHMFRNFGNLSHLCLINNTRAFQISVVFGCENKFYKGIGRMYLCNILPLLLGSKNFEMLEELNMSISCKDDDDDTPRKLRSFQLLYLYVSNQYGVDCRLGHMFSLLILWSSIPEPFLTVQEFEKSFRGVVPNVSRFPALAWRWYSDVVKGSDFCMEGQSPRSLKHYTRCVIRRSLRQNFQLPKGVKRLNLPNTLKQYLLLGNFKHGFSPEMYEGESVLDVLARYRQQIVL